MKNTRNEKNAKRTHPHMHARTNNDYDKLQTLWEQPWTEITVINQLVHDFLARPSFKRDKFGNPTEFLKKSIPHHEH